MPRTPSRGRSGKVVPLRGREGDPGPLDAVDLAIVRTLQANGRATFTEIGRDVGLSAPATHERVHRLEQRGVIRGYRVEIDPASVGLGVLSLVSVIPGDSCNMLELESAFSEVPEVEAAYTVAGDESHVLVVRTPSIADLSEVLQRLRDIAGVARTRTSVVLSTPVQRGPML